MKKTLKINFNKTIGSVIYFVEGGSTEFTINAETLLFATNEFLRYVESIDEDFDLDTISELNKAIYKNEEENSGLTGKYRAVSELVLSLLYLGIIEIEE